MTGQLFNCLVEEASLEVHIYAEQRLRLGVLDMKDYLIYIHIDEYISAYITLLLVHGGK